MKSKIEHTGTVVDISENILSIEICKQSACSGCHAKSVCMSSDQALKVIQVSGNGEDYEIGETVNVFLSTALGMNAVFISYILPLLILVFLLLSLPIIVINELLIGLISIGFLGIYYLLVYLFRDRLAKKFVFSVEKI